MARMTWGIGTLLGVTLLAVALASPAPRQPPGLFIQMDAGLLTVKAQAVPQRQILEGIAQALHVELIMAGPLAERKSLDLERQPWEDVLKKAVAPASWAGIYASTAGTSRLTKVVVFPPQRDQPPPAPSPIAPDRPPEAPAATAPPRGELGLHASLAELLAADNDETRAVAVVTLTTIGGAQAVEALTRALRDQAPLVRETAVAGLAEIGGELAIQGLQQALQDEDPEVRQAAQEALAQLQQEDR